ncbi:MAG: hypothetical protein R6V41_11720 [Desulfobacteraceae bacterium]
MTRLSGKAGKKIEKKKGLLKRLFAWIGRGAKKASATGNFCRT